MSANITTSCDSILRCQSCGAVLGVSGTLTLIVGAVMFNQTVTLKCAVCKKVKTWRPSEPSAETLTKARH